MKQTKYFLFAAGVALCFAACTSAPESDDAKTSDAQDVTATANAETYKVDASTSNVAWIGTKVSGTHSGDIKIKSGEVRVENGNVVGGNFVMDMTSINTTGPKGSQKEWDDKLTGHLKSPDFFDVEKFPDAKFEITAVKPFEGTVTDESDPRQEDLNRFKVTNPTHTVSGNLTIRDQTKNIEFPARITMNGNQAEALAKFNIDRKQWGLTYPGKPDDLIRDEIHLGIDLKASK